MDDKVVLLIGNDDDVLQSLAVSFAERGFNIALSAPQMPLEVANSIRDSVQSTGHRFIFLGDLGEMKNTEFAMMEIRREMGGIDFLVDMTDRSNGTESNQDPTQPRLWLSKNVLQELKN